MLDFTLDVPHGQKAKQSDFWLVNGKKDWAFIQGKLARTLGVKDGTPIRLTVGNERSFGAKHVYKRERRINIQKILRQHSTTKERYSEICKRETYAPEYVWLKLNSGGTAYTTEDDLKTKIALSMQPSSLLILTLQEHDTDSFYSVTSLIPRPNNNLDGQNIGRYLSSWVNK